MGMGSGIEPDGPARFRRVTEAWILTSLVLFLAMTVLGILMRFVQSDLAPALIAIYLTWKSAPQSLY